MVSRKYKYVYIRIPKSANSSVVRSLLSNFPEDGVDTVDIHRAKTSVVHLRDLAFHELRFVKSGAFIFSFVRNPFTRILSAYLDKFEGGAKMSVFGGAVAAHGGGKVSFPGFCRYLANGGEVENAHWMQQTRILGIAPRLDFIGQQETLERDLQIVTQRIGLVSGRSVQDQGAVRDGPPATNANDRLLEYYSPECIELVTRIYADDFQKLGYRPELEAALSGGSGAGSRMQAWGPSQTFA
ncbi:MAG: sulfotransferase family protein [Hoeflea sp.]|nr:sulfotransferase family protein [Hoeflea sp.]